MKKGNFATGIVLIILSVYGILEIGTWKEASDIISIKLYPYLVFGLIGIGGLILIGKVLASKTDCQLTFRWNKLLPVGLAVIVYGFIIKNVNYTIVTLVFFIVSMYLFGEKRWKKLIYISVPGTIAVYILFIKFLSVQL